MEISQDVMIDTALNAIGFLAAGGFMMVMFSLFRGRRKPSVVHRTDPGRPDDQTSKVESAPREAHRIEFIKLDRDRERTVPTHRSASDSYHRNRIEVIRLARKMIEAGAPADKVKSVLPISDAELALLTSHTT
jgi:hypothetical protein